MLLEKWCEGTDYKNVFEDPTLEKYRNETWGDLIDFEKRLKDEIQKQQVFAENLRFFTIRNIDWVKYKTSDYIFCLE